MIRGAISLPVLNDLIDGGWIPENNCRDPRVAGDGVGRALEYLQRKGVLRKNQVTA